VTISDELREWAETSTQSTWMAWPMPAHLANEVAGYRIPGEWLVALPPDDRRTFALLVAEALETQDD
jgi:hypothetical protein